MPEIIIRRVLRDSRSEKPFCRLSLYAFGLLLARGKMGPREPADALGRSGPGNFPVSGREGELGRGWVRVWVR
jgi:hypothetical protein